MATSLFSNHVGVSLACPNTFAAYMLACDAQNCQNYACTLGLSPTVADSSGFFLGAAFRVGISPTQSKVSPTAAWSSLGLDSLDSVELIMAFEEEFVIELPDEQV